MGARTECMTPELKPQQVGRSYDTWAFGCLLTELATYMEHGANGVSEFRSQRTTPYFHYLPVLCPREAFLSYRLLIARGASVNTFAVQQGYLSPYRYGITNGT